MLLGTIFSYEYLEKTTDFPRYEAEKLVFGFDSNMRISSTERKEFVQGMLAWRQDKREIYIGEGDMSCRERSFQPIIGKKDSAWRRVTVNRK